MAALWNDMGFFSWQSKAKTEGFETNRTLVAIVWGRVVGNDGERTHWIRLWDDVGFAG